MRADNVDKGFQMGNIVGIAQLLGGCIVGKQVDDGLHVGRVAAECINDRTENRELLCMRLVHNVPADDVVKFCVIGDDFLCHGICTGDVIRAVDAADTRIGDDGAQTEAAKDRKRLLVGFRSVVKWYQGHTA